MHLLALLHFAIAIYFAIHAVRTGQGLYWVLILLMFPLLGSLVYCVAIWMPEMSQSRGARQAVRTVKQALQPTRELQDAKLALEQADTLRNRLALGDALVAQKQWAAALEQFEAALARDPEAPDVQARVAEANLWTGNAARTLALTNATFPYAMKLANLGWQDACRRDGALRKGLNVVRGQVTYPGVAEAFDLPLVPADNVLA